MMGARKKMVGLRAFPDEVTLFEQAANVRSLTLSAWMRKNLCRDAIEQVYGTGDTFPATQGELLLARLCMTILLVVTSDIPIEERRRFAERTAIEIEKIKAGEWPQV